MKKQVMAAAMSALVLFGTGQVLPVQAEDTIANYYSSKNAPLIYGTSSITIPVGTDFDTLDTRFRVFAKDFEDGDMTAQLKVTGQVNTDKAGSYQLTYEATDSDGNKAVLQVPVTVSDNQEADIQVQRILYTIPSVWNMDLAGTNRCNYGDSQHLGIFLPADSQVKVRILKGEQELKVNLSGNDSRKESSLTIPGDQSWVTLLNEKEGQSYASVPLVTSPVMEKGTDLDTTITLELQYDSEVKELNYYHQGDDEEAFRQQWNQEKNAYGIVENEVLTALVPYEDLEKTTNYHQNGFQTLDDFLEYWKKVVDKMDALIGLEQNPANPVNQNVRTRYLVKANANGAGAAYYAGSHVGINSASIASFFEVNWGGLHEFAHGYQGSLGKGVMGLGEVSNNILGYYIQKDKEVYPYGGNWLGDFSEREDYFNQSRIETGEWPSGVDVRLYAICNLLDSFEGGTTYGKMFQWYRSALQSGKTMTNTDAYAQSLAELYQVNVIPYLEAWGLEVSAETGNAIYEKKLPVISILKDMVGEDSLETVMKAAETTEAYEVVTNDSYQNVKGNYTLSIAIDSLDSIAGKKATIWDGSQKIREFTIDAEEIILENLPVGVYSLQMPVSAEHSSDSRYLVVQEGENKSAITYARLSEYTYDKSMALKLQGIYHTYGCEVHFNSDYTKAEVRFHGASMGSDAPYLKILDETGKVIKEEKVSLSGDAFYFNYQQGNYSVDLKPGYVIEVHHPNQAKIQMFAGVTGQQTTAFGAENTTARYIVQEGGLRRESMTEEVADEAWYQLLKPVLEKTITDYQNSATEAELSDPKVNRAAREAVMIAYLNLKQEDQAPYTEFISKIQMADSVEGTAGAEVNTAPLVGGVGIAHIARGYEVEEFLYEAVSAYDFEDGTIDIDKDNTRIKTELDVNTPGSYQVEYFVSDSEGKEGTYTLTVVVQ